MHGRWCGSNFGFGIAGRKMVIRNSIISETSDIMKVYVNAKAFMIETGNNDQWSGAYPSTKLIEDDINKGNSYVCIIDGEIVGAFTYFLGIEPSYKKIIGKWTKDEAYGVIHRMGISKRGMNLGKECIKYCLKDCKYLRIDTHKANTPMRKLLKNNGFNECGLVYLKDGSERIAYDKD